MSEDRVEETGSEFVVLSYEPLKTSERAELSELGYVIFYENTVVPRLFCVRNVEGSVDELDALAFVEKASGSTSGYSEIERGEEE